jgi:hypothetical protein
MRDVLRRVLEMNLSGLSVQSVKREVRLVMVDVRLLTIGRMSVSVSS